MDDFLGIVDRLNTDLRLLFIENFKLSPTKGHHNIRTYRIDGTSYALNRYDYEPVKVLKWFERFWLFLEVKFITENPNKKTKVVHINISLSVYEGEDNDEKKVQLFRAEWDDMNNTTETHSQPHWHITSSQAIEKTFEEYSNHFDDGGFISLLEEQKSKLFDVKKIHFAMNGNWQSNQSHIHKISSAEQVSKWLKGLLSHVRSELEE